MNAGKSARNQAECKGETSQSSNFPADATPLLRSSKGAPSSCISIFLAFCQLSLNPTLAKFRTTTTLVSRPSTQDES